MSLVDEAVERALEDPVAALLGGRSPDEFLGASARVGDATPREAARERVREWAAEAGLAADPEELDELAEALAEALVDGGEALAFGVMVAAHPFGAETVGAAWWTSYGRVPGTMAVGRALAAYLGSLPGAGEADQDALGAAELGVAGRWPWVVGVAPDACTLRGADGEGWALERRGGRLTLRPLD
ncbi:MAG: hypothetical protein QOK40_1353 [Miltoncostaeaceae bacterium]|jgi:hypothetical protein|nr:hypothetical protein [Miltoncostaeaceae bacterium]